MEPHDEYDLLTAVALGILVGAGVALLFRRGPRGRRPIGTVVKGAGVGAAYAGRYGQKGLRWAADRGGELWDRVPTDEISEQVGEYLEAARDTISDAVSEELSDLRKAVRRQRKRLGI